MPKPELHLQPTLRPYQARPALAIIRAALAGTGDAFVVKMSRQAGKNELSAYIEATLLLAKRWTHSTGIKAAPTLKPQAEVSRRRLTRKLTDAGYPVRAVDNFVGVARARWGFFSAEKGANVVGQTADIMLECDEAQDVDAEKWEKDFMPMGATTDCPAVYYGTPWSDEDLLGKMSAGVPAANLFATPWDVVAESSPAYGRRAERTRDRLGANHPIWLTQYELQTIPGAGMLLSAAQLAGLRGNFPRQDAAARGYTYVAAVDVAGADTGLQLRGRDSTVMMIGRLVFPPDVKAPPVCHVVTAYEWTGTPHKQLFAQLARLAQSWKCRKVAVDSTTIGESAAHELARGLSDDVVIEYRFTQASKSALGFGLQAAATTGRLQFWANDDSPEYRRAFAELKLCRAEYLPNRMVRWAVPEADGHDDYVATAALLNHAAEQCPRPAVARQIA